jgi:hypothetical protein
VSEHNPDCHVNLAIVVVEQVLSALPRSVVITRARPLGDSLRGKEGRPCASW